MAGIPCFLPLISAGESERESVSESVRESKCYRVIVSEEQMRERARASERERE